MADSSRDPTAAQLHNIIDSPTGQADMSAAAKSKPVQRKTSVSETIVDAPRYL